MQPTPTCKLEEELRTGDFTYTTTHTHQFQTMYDGSKLVMGKQQPREQIHHLWPESDAPGRIKKDGSTTCSPCPPASWKMSCALETPQQLWLLPLLQTQARDAAGSWHGVPAMTPAAAAAAACGSAPCCHCCCSAGCELLQQRWR
jgi:hypothetical protein